MEIYRKRCEELNKAREILYRKIKSSLPQEEKDKPYTDLEKYLDLVYEIKRKDESVQVYSKAIQTALDNEAAVYIPYFDHPLYLTEPVILNSGNSLKVHPDTRLILIGDTCMLHNRNVMDGHYNVLSPGPHSDRGISVSGGIWELPDTVRLNDDPYRDYPGCDAGFVLHNIINVRLENMLIRNTNRMGLQLGNCDGFVVQDIRFENAGRDGIHLEGPAANGVVRKIEGRVGDDAVALNAWDWTNASLTFGAIHDVIVEDITCEPGYLWSEMRLHPGNKELPDGRIIECPLYNIIFKNISGVHTIKLYNQPNLMPGQSKDHSTGIGCLYHIFFEDITFDYLDEKDYYTQKDAAFELHADTYDISFRNIRFNYPLCDEKYSGYHAVAVGPMSVTWKITEDPKDWIDFFEANSICKVSRLALEDISVNGERCTDLDKLLYIRRLTVNPDYPKTTPKGGTGFGVVDSLYID